ncbi:MAG: glycosyltransferase [Elainellaceae cyanobacterium]
MQPLNLFFEIPDNDRWFPFDRYPRKVVRSIVRRNQPVPGGYRRSFRELCKGLEQLNVPFRLNDYRYIRKHPNELACVYGYPHVLDKLSQDTPILFGAGGYSHPVDNPNLIKKHNIKGILVKGSWMVEMCQPFWGTLVHEWAAPIDTEVWAPNPAIKKDIDFLIYDKVRWDYEKYSEKLIQPILDHLNELELSVSILRYGQYLEPQLKEIAQRAKAMIFLCEHETQGLAYQQVLATDVPILAWDRGGYWQDPSYFPHRVKFAPVSSVPYWNDCCGIKFAGINDFPEKLDDFLAKLSAKDFFPRQYVMGNLTLEKCAQNYLDILYKVQHEFNLSQ